MALTSYSGLSKSGGLTSFPGLSPAGGLTPSAGNYVIAANNSSIPTNINNSANWVNNCWTKHKSGPVAYSGIKVVFVNWYMGTNQETAGPYEFVLRAGIYVNGTFTRITFNGAVDVVVGTNFGQVVGYANVTIPANTEFFITNRRIATDGGAAGTYNILTNTGGATVRQDGLIAGTNPAIDYTLGVGLAFGATCATPVINRAGVITSIPKALGGSGYSGGLSVVVWDGPANGVTANQAGRLTPGTGWGGYGTTSAGAFSSVTTTSGGAQYSAVNPPQVFVGGAGTGATGFGSTTAAYGPACIMGIPSATCPNILLVGDSIAAGYGSNDAVGDLVANFGCYEQAIKNRGGVMKLTVSGESSAGWLQNNTHQLAYLGFLITNGLQLDNAILALGTNDFNSNNNSNVITAVQGFMAQIITLLKAKGVRRCYTTTVFPSTTGSWTTLAGQTPTLVGGASTNYGAGGRVSQYNAAIVNGSGVPTQDGYIDGASIVADASTPSLFRVDTYKGAVGVTADGIHPNTGAGTPYIVRHLDLTPIFPITNTFLLMENGNFIALEDGTSLITIGEQNG